MSKIITGFSYIAMMISILFNGIEALFITKPSEPKSEAELIEMQNVFDEYEINDEITVINLSALNMAQRHTVISLQGLVAREKPSIFINYGSSSNKYALEEMKKAGYKLSYNDENGKPWSFASIIKKYSSFIKDSGYILYKTHEDHGQLNTATNLATINGWLPVTTELEEVAISLGLKKCADISHDHIDLKYLKNFYKEYKDCFRKDSLVHLYYYAPGMRDFAIQQNIFVIYFDDEDYSGIVFRDKIMRDLKPASLIFGWCQYEVKFTESASRFGHTVIPSDHSNNLSILSSFKVTNERFDTEFPEKVTLTPNKHYVTIVFSDGDNAQWIQNGFSEYHTWQSYNREESVNWTFCPILTKLSEVDIKRTLEASDDVTFIAGPSGGGYSRVSKMSSKELEAFSDYTASVMLHSGLNIITFLDKVENEVFHRDIEKRLAYFSRYNNIKGGILQLDPDRYSSGGGRVYFSDGKPFVSVGFSLWHPSGNADEVTKEWLKEQADIINSKESDINTINGYTVINVHPWTVGTDDLLYFINCLGDNIELLDTEDFLCAVKQNIPNVSATKD